MSCENWSFTVRVWCDQDTGGAIQVLSTDEARAVYLNDSRYLVRVAIDAEHRITRCQVRHIDSGREIHVQGGLGLRSFVESFLLSPCGPASTCSDEVGE
jgi:hypothetical protein